MSSVKITEVSDREDARRFLLFPVELYKDDRNWVRPLDDDIESVFDRERNRLFRTGDAVRYLAIDSNGDVVGRVAAFYDKKSAAAARQPTGGIGFFESVNSREVAFALFDKCRDWLAGRGMEAMDGPINFGDRDRWWGLLVEGFYPPNYAMPYNYQYYRDLFESYGFKNYFNQYTYHREVSEEGVNPVIMAKAEKVMSNPDYRFSFPSKSEMASVPLHFMKVYNEAWAGYQGGRGISEAHAKILFKKMKPIIDRRLLWFGYYKDEPVCFFIMLPEINPIIKRLNGRMGLAGKVRFLYHRHIARSVKRAFGLIFGVVPSHQKRGVEGALIIAFANSVNHPRFPYRELEFNWIGDFNPSMMHLMEQIGASVKKKHITYRYIFDRDAPFERAAKVNVER